MLQVEHLSKSYRIGNQVYPVLKDISIEVEKGEFVAVMGPSGSGKTTLLNCISRFIPYDEGAVLMGGEDISRLKEDELAKVRNRKMGFVFQDFMLLDGLTVFENICLPQIIDERPAARWSQRRRISAGYLGLIRSCRSIRLRYPEGRSRGPLWQGRL